MIRWLFLTLALCALASTAHAKCTGSSAPIVQGLAGAPFTCDAGSTPQSTDIVQGGQVATGNTVGWTWGQIFAAFPQAGNPAGTDTMLQFNNAGLFGADASLTFNNTTKAVTASQLSLTFGATALSIPNGNASIGGTLGVTGNATFGGTLTLPGASSISASARVLNLNTTNGTVFDIFDANAAVANKLTLQGPAAATSPLIFSTSGVGGVQFSSYLSATRVIAYAGTSSVANGNQVFNITGTITGTSADTGQYSINPSKAFFEHVSGNLAEWRNDQINIAAGFYGEAGGGIVTTGQTGAPGTLGVWATSQTETTQGQLTQNNTLEYELTTVPASLPCTTASSGGGPTGTGTSISDGGCTWRYVTIVASGYNLSGFGLQANASFNVGGSTSDWRGIVQGGNSIASLTGAATGYLGMVAHEFDCTLALTASVQKRACVQIVSTIAGGQAAQQDAGLSFGGSVVSGFPPVGAFINGIMFADGGVDPNGYGINFNFWNTGGAYSIAGGIDLLRVNANGVGAAGGGFPIRWGNGEITNPTGQTAGGDLYLGYASLHVTSTGLTIDAPNYMITGTSAFSGGTNYSTGTYVTDNHGNRGTVTQSSGVPSAITITQFGSSVAPYTSSTWTADQLSGVITSGGATALMTSFTTTDTTAQVSSPTITLGGTSQVTLAASKIAAPNLPTTCTGHSGFVAAVSNVLTLCP